MRRSLILVVVFGASVLAVAQQQPKVTNAQFHTEAVNGGLSATVARIKHVNTLQWLGYEVAATPGMHFSMCSSNIESPTNEGCCGVYRLEGDNNFRSSDEDKGTEVNIDILVRIANGTIDKIRFIGASCRLDAGGLPFTWLTGVQADDSVAWLSNLVRDDNKHHADSALAAIAAHATAKATDALKNFAAPVNPLWLREKAAFWLGAGRGHDGFLALKQLESDSDPEFRKKLVFDLFVSHDAAAVDDLIQLAKADKDVGVREQAIFWVGQKASKKTVAMLKDTVENDPEVAVKKKAVFALSLLPKDQAVPELLHVAETNHDPAVRKQAIFWLGQTHDPRALAYFEKILKP